MDNNKHKEVTADCGECGSFKTTRLVEKVAKGIKRGWRYVIVQPTKELCKETYDKLKAHNVSVSLINEDTVRGGVIEQVNQMLCHNTANTILITHATFQNMSSKMSQGWRLELDEDLQIYDNLNANISRSYEMVDWHDFFDFKEATGTIHKMQPLTDDNLVDANLTAISDYLKAANNPVKDVYCEFAEGTYLRDRTNGIYINGFSLLNEKRFEGFEEITIYGAMIERSLLVKMLRGSGFYINTVNSFQKHQKNVVIHHGNAPTWSFSLINDQPQLLPNFEKFVHRQTYDEDCIWLTPKKIDNPAEIDNQVNHMCYGLNKHSHKKHVAISACCNRSQQFNSFLKDIFRMDADDRYLHANGQMVYQTVMRTALRDPNNYDTVHVYLPDRRSAEFLSNNFFENASLVEFDIGYEEKSKKQKTAEEITEQEKRKRENATFRQRKKRFLKDNSQYKDLERSDLEALDEWVERFF